MGIKMCLYGLFLGLSFAIAGNFFLSSLGVTVPAFRIGGGLLLGVAAWGLLYSSPTPPTKETSPEHALRSDISLCPLAFPMFIGPATLTTLIGMIQEAQTISDFEPVLVIGAMIFIILLTYILILFGGTIVKILGRNGAIILEKIGGILLIAMSIEMISGGIKAYFGW